MLRISPLDRLEYKKAEFENMKYVFNLGIPMCETGKILKKLHDIPVPEGIEAWDIFFNRKMNQKIEAYKNCELKYENGEAFIEYIEENRQYCKIVQ